MIIIFNICAVGIIVFAVLLFYYIKINEKKFFFNFSRKCSQLVRNDEKNIITFEVTKYSWIWGNNFNNDDNYDVVYICV